MSRSRVVSVVPCGELVLREFVSVPSESSGSASEFLAYRKRKNKAFASGASPKDTLPAVFEGLRHSARRLKTRRIGRQLNAFGKDPEFRLDALC